MKSSLLFFLTAMLFLLNSCGKESVSAGKEPKDLKLPLKATEVINKGNAFGINLFKTTSLVQEGNLMLSPLSAGSALTMLLNGCNGETYNQIHGMLGFENMTLDEVNDAYQSLVSQILDADPEVEIGIANAVWYRQGFGVKPPFLDIMHSAFSAETGQLDFLSPSALATINGWASDHTNGKIPKVLNEISPDAVMFLMNALYFKGSWTDRFDENLTSPGAFYPENGSTVQVQMMRGKIPAKTYETNEFAAIELTYGRANFSMIVIVPEAGLSGFIEGFSNTAWQDLTNTIDASSYPHETNVVMPKFKFSFEKVLNDQLKSLGMIDAFDPLTADLSGISDEDIFVSFVKQNTFIEVNEEGTEAAAITTIGIELTSMPEPHYFIADKPFVFVIRERTTNTILFIGKVELPEY